MRRPTPLPEAPASPRAPQPTPLAVEQPPVEEHPVGEQPHAPLPLPTAHPEVAADAVDAPSARLRDVWGAARARRRALRGEVRRFTAHSRRRRMVWIGAAAALVVLVLGTLGAAYSPLFAVERITVVGADALDAAEVQAALAGQVGRPLPLVDDSEVKDALVAFPLIETYSLEAQPPHDLVLRIVERTPVGVVPSAAGYTLVDAAGVALSTTAEVPPGQPVIEVAGGAQTAAFTAVGRVIRSLPETIRPQVTGVTASSPDDVTLTLAETRTTIVWGGAEQSAKKALVLETMMQTRPPSDVSMYDVSSPEAIIVR
ncbi:MAG: FtsQ-type POTRA domain-containing protein [Microbacterium sp.]|uniref:FtsQ-type POTRA domain-containing protein n=1 Tax=Microbacterium sp. TaxID=51671 RepID=UPI003A8BB351